MDEVEERIQALTEPVLARHGAELVECIVRRGRSQLVRLVVDREGGVDVETCARVSEEVSRLLDVDDPLAGRYTLEVTSPGLDRPLRKPADFRRHLGKAVRVVLPTAQYEGTLEDVDEVWVRLSTGQGRVSVPLSDIASAKVVLPW